MAPCKKGLTKYFKTFFFFLSLVVNSTKRFAFKNLKDFQLQRPTLASRLKKENSMELPPPTPVYDLFSNDPGRLKGSAQKNTLLSIMGDINGIHIGTQSKEDSKLNSLQLPGISNLSKEPLSATPRKTQRGG